MSLAVCLRSPWIIALACLAWLALAVPATAQEDRKEARALFDRGVAAYDAGDMTSALDAFERAYRLAPHPAVRVNMANCFEQLGRVVEAVFNFRRFLEESGTGVDPAQRVEVEAAIARLTQRIATLKIELEPRTARVRIDGEAPRRTPEGAVLLAQGTYTIEVSAPGFVTQTRQVRLSGGLETQESFVLSSEAAAPAVMVPHGTQGESDSQADAAPRLELGTSAARADGEARSHSPLFWVAASATATLAVGFAVSGGLALSAQSDFDAKVVESNDRARSPGEREAAKLEGQDLADRADKLAVLSDVFLAGSVVAGGATLLVWLTDRKAQKRAAMRAGPMVLRHGGGGLVFGGKF